MIVGREMIVGRARMLSEPLSFDPWNWNIVATSAKPTCRYGYNLG